MLDEFLKRSLSARVYDVARETPLEYAPKLSERVGHAVWLKREDTQPVFSFKLRGAFNKIASLTAADRESGVVAASAGNHAQGVALSAAKFGCRSVIVMPKTTPQIKVDAVRSLGGEVILEGDNYDEASAFAMAYCATEGMTYVHPYDDPEVIAGQGTIALELLRQIAGFDVVFVPVGGGGLIAGIGAVIKALRPEVRIIGVEPEDAASMKAALVSGSPVELASVGRFADGVAVKKVGALTFEIGQRVIDEIVTVTNDEICGAIKEIFEDRRAILEPAGALAYAGLRKWSVGAARPLVLVGIACGANINFDSLRHVSERAEIGERREAVLAVTIPEVPGSFKRFCKVIGARSITEFNYRYADTATAHVFVGMRVSGQGDTDEVLCELERSGFPVLDLTDDEMSKLHLRHMVGGRAGLNVEEALYRFEFPERGGALIHFLEALGSEFNISLFHYRNHGSDVGRVLAGFHVSADQMAAFETRLQTCGYPFAPETHNPAYQMFLR
jgi:threonine dehydratase